MVVREFLTSLLTRKQERGMATAHRYLGHHLQLSHYLLRFEFCFQMFDPSLGPLGRIYSTPHLLRSISGWRRAPKVSHLGVSGRPVSGSPGFVAPAALG